MGRKLTVLLVLVFVVTGGGSAMASVIEDVMFSNKKYSDNIDMETYVVSEERLADILANHWQKKMVQETHRELYRKTVYFVVRVKNKGDLAAWGMLACRINGDNFKVYIAGVPFDKWFSYVVPRGEFTFPNNDAVPVVETKWEKLYTK